MYIPTINGLVIRIKIKKKKWNKREPCFDFFLRFSNGERYLNKVSRLVSLSINRQLDVTTIPWKPRCWKIPDQFSDKPKNRNARYNLRNNLANIARCKPDGNYGRLLIPNFCPNYRYAFKFELVIYYLINYAFLRVYTQQLRTFEITSLYDRFGF